MRMPAEGEKARRTVAFVGNCQADALTDVYRDRIAPLLGDRAIYVSGLPGQSAEHVARIVAQLQQADVVVEQKFDAGDPLPAEFPGRPRLRRIRFPHLSGRFYWPYGGVAHVGGKKEGEPGAGTPYVAEIGDSF